MKKQLILLTAVALGFSACNVNQNEVAEADSVALKAINETALSKHIAILASDEYEGRKPFTAGEMKTINYLKDEFEKMGLKPGNGESYFQEVPMVDVKSTPTDLMIRSATGDATMNLKYLDDFVAASRHLVSQVKVDNSQLVFAGYGIVAPEYKWNDYEGLDVKGKTVVVMVNDPGFLDSTLFKGKTMTYYGRWTYKFEEAARQGATGVIIIHEDKAASYPWAVVRSGWSKSKLYLAAEDDNKSRALLEGWITQDVARELFKMAHKSADLMVQAGKKGFKPVDLSLKLSTTIDNTIQRSKSNNVVAVLPGTKRPDEFIIYSGHWDHLGKGEAVNGDSIYNGAVDNATGTAALLVLANAFKKAVQQPERSIMFLAVTAEEQGLLGSEYYASNPLVPVTKTVANINIDAMQAFGKTKDIIAVGYGQSELEDYLETAAKKQGRVVVKDSNPSAGFYFRSDHFNFAKVGIPALYTETGDDHVAKGLAFGKAQKEDYTANRYHAPADNFEPDKWDFSGMVADLSLLFDVGYRLSNETTFPGWKAGSEFKAIRDKGMK
ncbi:M28 family metallopeptidase [Pedobacter insulae]|uniref:Zn-dependent amino-or carboxypeptidase, M28 family n=1 Tax=Pedobacter insulae TaxID=414048 RepID=A0A1I2UG13_9SPHI|nr:M28 family metallopeptidase [Pedobacter insulae]SFG76102.1 Zn-dependent amino-or carboxypeptidase, M28 family [Pedobacter insulae]